MRLSASKWKKNLKDEKRSAAGHAGDGGDTRRDVIRGGGGGGDVMVMVRGGGQREQSPATARELVGLGAISQRELRLLPALFTCAA